MNTYTKEIIGIIALLIAGIVVFFLATLAPQTEELPTNDSTMGGMEGKINIDEVCASALTYTTFTDGAAAEAFIQECKEGKHPDVIERYFEQMGIPDGAAI